MPISATGNKRTRQRGFTLVEMMVVLVVAGLLAGAVVLTMPARAPDAEQQAVRFAAKARLASEDSVMTGSPVGLSVTAEGYIFFRLQQGRWIIDGRKPFAPQSWGEGIIAAMQREGEKAVIAEKSATTAPRPMIIFDPSGPSTPFDVVVQNADAIFTVSGDESGDVGMRNHQVADAR